MTRGAKIAVPAALVAATKHARRIASVGRTKNRQARRVSVAYYRLGRALAAAEGIADTIAHGFDFDKPTRWLRSKLLDALNEVEDRLEAARVEAENLADPEARKP